MLITTKFDISQTVWVMLRQKNDKGKMQDNIMTEKEPNSRKIQGITRDSYAGRERTTYHLEIYRGVFRCDYDESEVFETEGRLLNYEKIRYGKRTI
jgi:hypothetical protein